MKLKDRLNAKSSKLGKIFHTWIAGLFLLCSSVGAANEYLSIIPPEVIPVWVKTVVALAGLISFVGGKLTVQSNEQKATA